MPNYITLFQQKKQKPLTENHPVQSGVIKINEPLPAGDYEFGIYDKVSKGGNPYRSGQIKPAFKKVAQPFNEPKEPESNLDKLDENTDDIPF